MVERFLRNTWYMAGWPEDVTRTPMRRLFLGEPVVMYRTEQGAPIALRDACPHRQVPLSRGRLIGDELECAYHGLRFLPDGSCSLNPHGDGKIAPAMCVRHYPIMERHGALWIWMGDPGRADPARLTDFPALGDSARFTRITGSFRIEANYQLVTDNLLDLSHVDYLHAGLKRVGDFKRRHEVRQEDDRVVSMLWRDNAMPNKLWQNVWPADTPGDTWAHMRWDAPCLLQLDSGMTPVGKGADEAMSMPSVHLLTPETEHSTHYFWAFLRDVAKDDAALDGRLREIGVYTFEMEDLPIIELQQANLDALGPESPSPVLLAPDAAAVRARRTLSRLIAEESGSA